jgi:glycosyltransferase involved in cell wall biosynthesis
MTLVHLAIFLPSLEGGGAERAFVDLANLLADDGYSVDLVLASAHGAYLPLVKEGVRVVDLRCTRVITSLPKLRAYLRREHPVAILSALSHANVVAVGAHIAAASCSRLVVSERNTLDSGSRTFSKEWVVRKVLRLAYYRASAIVAVSKGVEDDLRTIIRVSPKKLRVIYNPIDIADIRRRAVASVSHPWLDMASPPVILGVGRLTAQKDFATLITAFSYVRARQVARLVIFGEGEKRAELESLARELEVEDDVWMPGFTDNPFRWMRRAAVFVLSSRYEGFPNVLIQAMACGASIVSTDCHSGPAEILSCGYPARLVPVGDVLAMSEAIAKTIEVSSLAEPALPDEMFSNDGVRQRYIEVLFGPCAGPM